MNARNSDDDLRNFMPDMAAIRRAADPAYAERKLREALNNPELDKALAEVRALKAEEATMTASSIKAPAPLSRAAPPRKAAVYTLAVLAALVPAGLVLVLVKREPPAAQVAVPAGSGPASVNAAATSAAPPPAVSSGEAAGAGASDGVRAAVDASAPDASTAPAIEPVLGTRTPQLSGPGRAPLNKGSATAERAGSAATGPKGSASEGPKPPASASPRTGPVNETEIMPWLDDASEGPKPPASAPPRTGPVNENEIMPWLDGASEGPKPPASAPPRRAPVSKKEIKP
jgi:hypothetical protein